MNKLATITKQKQRAWPADRVEKWPLGKIIPYARNPRSHSEEQIAQIAASMQRFGVTAPVLVDEKGVLIYGHGRLRAAQRLGLTHLPVSIAKGWSDTDKRAYRIADNQLALNAEWDVPLLKVELRDLRLENFDMPLLGFANLELVEFMAGMGDGVDQQQSNEDSGIERELSDAEKALLVKAWQQLVADWLANIEEQKILSTNFTKGALAANFLRARFYGANIPSAATLAYNPHRVWISADKNGSLLDGLRKAATNEDNIIERLWFILDGQPRFDKMLMSTLPFLSHRMPGDFPIDLARSLYDEFVDAPSGRVLDPCHGWGGRMLGFLLAENTMSYHGFDTDKRTVAGVTAIFDDLKGYAASKKTAKLENKPFEQARLAAESYDFALTSPPYFDIEKYDGEQSSWRKYKTFDAWVDGFYRPLIVKTASALKDGATFALQIGNQVNPLEEVAKQIANSVKLEYAETRHTGMTNNVQDTAPERGEVIVILRKANRR